MAETQATVALNIGSQRISMAIFEPGKNGGLLLRAYDSSSILADPATESSRIPQIRLAVSELAQKLGVSKTKVLYAVSGQAVFTRFVKLPPLEDDNIEQLVTFEAQQHVPFPINEVVWDYQLLEGDGDKEVVLVAIKGDSLDEINEAVTDAGLYTAEVDVAPMAMYNGFRYNYPDVAEPILIIDIGAKTTNLLYIEGKRFFTRSVAVGGVSLSTSIAKEYGVGFSEAEAQKVSNGLVTLGGGHSDQLDESIAALGMVLRNALMRIPAEIARTTNYFRSQHGGSAPTRVFLAGGGSNLPYIKEFFEEKLSLPVEFFNPLQRITVGKKVDVERLSHEAHLMGELIGLGVRGIGKSVVNIDLVPASVVQERAEERRKPYLIASAAALLIGFAAWGTFNSLASAKAVQLASDLRQKVGAIGQYDGPIRQLIAHEDDVRAVVDGYVTSEKQRIYWMDVLVELKTRMAHDSVWVVDFEPLVGYDPSSPQGAGSAPAAPAAAPTASPPKVAGTPVVAKSFGTTGYSISSLALPLESAAPAAVVNPGPRGRRPVDAGKSVAPMINAVHIRGLWRDNTDGPNVVYKLLENLRGGENSMFNFNPMVDGKPVPLTDEQIIRQLQTSRKDGELAWSFELVLPLAEPMPLQ